MIDKRILLASVLLVAVAVCSFGQKCRQFINYQTKTVDFRGLSVDVMGKATGKTDGVAVSSVQREATDEIQKLDLLQYNMCNQMKSVKSESVREKLAMQQNNLLIKMLNMQDGGNSQPVAVENDADANAEKNVKPAPIPAPAPVATPAVSNANVDVDFPCMGENYYSTDDLIRGTGEGWSMDAQIAKRAARTAALEDLAAKIEITVKTLTEDYSISKRNNMDENLMQTLENKTQTIVNQTISGWKTICEKTRFNEAKNRYTHYIAIEISVKRVIEGVYSKLREDAAIKNALPPQEVFEKKFSEIMNTYEQSEEMEF